MNLRMVVMALVACLASACMPEMGELTVVKQATPNPLVGVKSFAVAPVTWEGFTYEGQPEEAWLATRTDEQRASFANDKVRIHEKLLDRLVVDKNDDESFVAGSGAPFTLAYNVHAYADGKFHWTLRVLDASGQLVDEVNGPPSGYGFGFAPQLEYFVVVAGTHTLRYLRARYGG
jgi:hypothetical protein